MAIHTYDLARLISGADPVSVYCHEHDPKGTWYEGGKAAATAIFEMTDGVVFSYRGHWCAESDPGSAGTGWWGQWRAVGDGGTAVCLDENQPWADATAGPRTRPWAEHRRVEPGPVDAKRVGGHAGLIQDFVDCIRTGRTPETSCADNIKTLAMVFASIESAESRSRADVTW
jgi:predicted dehydrogenase